MEGEIDHDGNNGETKNGRDEELLAVVDYIAEHGFAFVLLLGTGFHRLRLLKVIQDEFLDLRTNCLEFYVQPQKKKRMIESNYNGILTVYVSRGLPVFIA